MIDKRFIFIRHLLLVFSFILIFFACQNQYNNLSIKHYFKALEALSEDNYHKSMEEFKSFNQKIKSWLTYQLENQESDGKKISIIRNLNIKVEEILKQTNLKGIRRHLNELSYDLSTLILNHPKIIEEQTHFYQCPMVPKLYGSIHNPSEAYWISQNREINNPYFGEMMLKCGIKTQSIKR